MNTRFSAQNRTGSQLDPTSFGNPPDAARPSMQTGPSGMFEEDTGAAQSFRDGGHSSPGNSAQQTAASQAADPFAAYPRPDSTFPDQLGTGTFPGQRTEPWLNSSSQAAAGTHPENYPGYFGANGIPNPGPYPDAYLPGAGAPLAEAPVSPVHATLIVMILLAGLALGIGRWWWIDEKIDAASARKSAVATLPSDQYIDETSSLQSSIDSAYIPSMTSPEDGAPTDAAPADRAMVPGSDQETPEVPAAVQANGKPNSSSGLKQTQGSQESAEESKYSAAPRTEHSQSREEKKPRSRPEGTSQKLASTAKKERMSEIDRVRSQAYSETTKDRIGERKSNSSRSSIGPQSDRRDSYRTRKVAQSTVTSAEFARCLRIDHIIRREQCKWSLCNNKWGKGACPSY